MLILKLVFWAAMMLVQGGPWMGGGLFTLRAVLKIPSSFAFLLSCRGMPVLVGPWTPTALFGFAAMPLTYLFHSFGVRGRICTDLENLVLKQLWLPALSFLSPSLKTEIKQYSLILLFCPKYVLT